MDASLSYYELTTGDNPGQVTPETTVGRGKMVQSYSAVPSGTQERPLRMLLTLVSIRITTSSS